MAQEFHGDAQQMRKRATQTLEQILGLKTSRWAPLDRSTFEEFCAGSYSGSGSAQLDDAKKKPGLIRIIRAKAKPDEMLCLHLTQQHGRLREALLKLGQEQQI